jgi:intracellular sulfur oxidation DsrE/DsrF family protein
MKKSLSVCALLFCLLAASNNTFAQTATPATAQTAPPATAQTATQTIKTHHVVFTITSGDQADWNLTLGNMRNLLTAFGTDPYEVELVAFGPGIAILQTPSAVIADIQGLQEKHVHFKACENSMRARKLTVADLVPGSEPVPAGIAEVVAKQEQGWIYIKGGR